MIGAYKDATNIRINGFHIANERFVVLKAEDRSLYGKKVCMPRPELDRPLFLGLCSRYIPNRVLTHLQDKEGIIIVKTTQAILVAHYPSTVQPGAATNTVEQLADYLIGVGY